MKRFSIRFRLLVLPVLALIIVISAGQTLSGRIVRHQFSLETRTRQSREISLIHQFIEVVQQKALENYLKGIADDLLTSIASIDAAMARGAITPEQASRNISVSLQNRTIGESGYVYAVDSTGTVRYHPNPDLQGRTLIEYDFIQKQIERKEGYLEYSWANPGEAEEQEKALYMSYYEPLDWILSVSAYRKDFSDLISVTDLRSFIHDISDNYDFTYILDETGRYLIHPDREGSNIASDPEHRELAERIQNASPGGELFRDAADAGPNRSHDYMVRYSFLEDFGWYVVSEIDLQQNRKTVESMQTATNLIVLVSLLITSLVLYALGRSITRPIVSLHTMVSRGRKEVKAPITSGDEIENLTSAFLAYRRELNDERKNLAGVARFVDSSPMPILRIDSNWNCLFANEAARKSVSSEILGSDDRVTGSWQALLRPGYEENRVLPVRVAGRQYLCSSSGSDSDGEYYLAFLDVTDGKRYETLRSIWHGVFDHSIEGITITDQNGNVERVNESFSRITGYPKDEIVGKSTNLLKSGVHHEAFYREMWSEIGEKGYWENEIWNRRKDGEIYPEWLSISAFEDSATGGRKYMAIFHDITRLKNQERIINQMKMVDKLTNLPNRDNFHAVLEKLHSSGTAEARNTAVVVLDLDGFSKINESYGLPTGDSILQFAAAELGTVIRSGDLLARIGGDEFGIILSRMDGPENHQFVVERIMAVFNEDFVVDGRRIHLSASAGVVFMPEEGSKADVLFANALAALRRAKTTTPGTYTVYDGKLDTGTAERLELELALREALPGGELYLEYQPIVEASTGRAVSFEALLRWKRGDEIISPAEFIPIAEDTGLIIPIGRWIIGEACRAVSRFPSSNRPKIAVNISARQFSDPSFLDELISTVQRNRIPTDCIGLEITENIAAADVEGTISLLKRISSAGFPIAIDDFGTGYSSLKYILDFAFNILKIDKSFVDGLPDSGDSLAIIRAIVSMGHSLGKTIIAEGVENSTQLHILRELECEKIQGYHYSRPLSLDDALKYWEENRPVLGTGRESA